MKNQLLLQTIKKEKITYPPLWLMRQAGRYLPEYRQLRLEAGSFLELCKNPELAMEATLQPLKRFNFDAAILFSDILVIPDALGMDLYFIDHEGPKFKNIINKIDDIEKLLTIENSTLKLNYVYQTIIKLKSTLEVPLIGFAGSPFTLACYILEGGSSKNHSCTKTWLYQQPILFHRLLQFLTDHIVSYLLAQIDAGIDCYMIFDSWGGILTESCYAEFSLQYIVQIITRIELIHNIPSIMFTKGAGAWLNLLQEQIASGFNPQVIGIDWSMEIGRARKILSAKIAIQGNLDPILLSVGDKITITGAVDNIINNYRKANNDDLSGLIFNLGHGILPSAKIDNVHYLIDAVRKHC